MGGTRRRGDMGRNGDDSMKICSIEGCEYELEARGFCQIHYMRWRRGTLLSAETRRPTQPNPHAAKVVELAAAGASIASIMERSGLNKNTVSGLIWRGRKRGDLFSGKTEQMIETMASQYPGFPRNPFPDRGGCLYPNWYEPRDPGFAFCGRPVSEVGGSWCPECRGRVYQTLRGAT